MTRAEASDAHRPLDGKRILVCGKGGSGKSSIVALLARALASRGYHVVAIDGDASNPGGLAPLLLEKPLATRPLELNELAMEYKAEDDGITLLRVGKIERAREGCHGPMSKVTRDLPIADEVVSLIDVEAGIEHFGRGVEQHVDLVLVVVDPSSESLAIAARIAALARQMEVARAAAILNRAGPSVREAMTSRVEAAGLPVLGTLERVDELERAGFEGRALPLATVAHTLTAIVEALEGFARTDRNRATGRKESSVSMVSGIFSRADAAEQAVRDLVDAHFRSADISIAVTDRAGTHAEAVEHDTGVAEGAVGGAAIGGLLGLLGATLVSTGVIAAPGLVVFASGPLLAALQGAVGGAAIGNWVGAVAGLGFWKDEAEIHANALAKGGIVVAVPAIDAHAEQARRIFAQAGADRVVG